MILLDEQIREDQRDLLRKWRIHFRQIGKEIASPGIKDENIIPLLQSQKHPTFFTHDQGFFSRRLLHSHYCLVWLDVSDVEAAVYIRRFLVMPSSPPRRNGWALLHVPLTARFNSGEGQAPLRSFRLGTNQEGLELNLGLPSGERAARRAARRTQPQG